MKQAEEPLYIGLISGTSMDGIDAVLMEPKKHCVYYGLTYPYSDEVKKLLHLISPVAEIKLKLLMPPMFSMAKGL